MACVPPRVDTPERRADRTVVFETTSAATYGVSVATPSIHQVPDADMPTGEDREAFRATSYLTRLGSARRPDVDFRALDAYMAVSYRDRQPTSCRSAINRVATRGRRADETAPV